MPDADRSVPGTDGISLFMPFGVVNADDPHCGYFREATSRPTVRYSLTDSAAELSARIHSADLSETGFSLFERGNELGRYTSDAPAVHVENAMARSSQVSGATGHREGTRAVPGSLKGVTGRMSSGAPRPAFSVLSRLRSTHGFVRRVLPFARRYTKGKVIAVFGSGASVTERTPDPGIARAKYCGTCSCSRTKTPAWDRMKILEESLRERAPPGNDARYCSYRKRREGSVTRFGRRHPEDRCCFL